MQETHGADCGYLQEGKGKSQCTGCTQTRWG